MAAIESTSCDWLLSIRIPTIELRDALITDVAEGVRAAGRPKVVAVRMIGVVEDRVVPALTMHIRTRSAISGAQAEALGTQTLHQHASRLDLTDITVSVVRPLSPDEPSGGKS
ncbi:MAG TPA: hypothetical protein VFH00_08095 [Candidatus Nitrosotalea sp.]|nr:hypothetical protein [Candidatus Nitrosotalea sp.]